MMMMMMMMMVKMVMMMTTTTTTTTTTTMKMMWVLDGSLRGALARHGNSSAPVRGLSAPGQ